MVTLAETISKGKQDISTAEKQLGVAEAATPPSVTIEAQQRFLSDPSQRRQIQLQGGLSQIFAEQRTKQQAARIQIVKGKKQIREAEVVKGEIDLFEAQRQDFFRRQREAVSKQRTETFNIATGVSGAELLDPKQFAQQAERRKEQLAILKEGGLDPVFKEGTLLGFSSEKEQMSFRVEDVGAFPSAVSTLKEAGLVDAPTPGQQFISQGLALDTSQLQMSVREEPRTSFIKEGAGRVATTFGRGVSRIGGALEEVKEIGKATPGKAGFPVRVVSEFIPTTPLGIGALIVAPLAFGKLASVAPRIARGTGIGIGTLQLPGVIDPSLTLEQRTAAGLGAGLGFGGAALVKTKFQLGVKSQKTQVKSLFKEGFITEETSQQLLKGIEIQKFLRKQPDVPVVRTVPEAFPKKLTLAEQEAFASVALEGRIFGSQATRLRGLQKVGGDIDIAFKQNRQVLKEFEATLESISPGQVIQRGEAIGLRKLPEKAFDIKPLERLEEFAFFEKRTAEIPGGGKVTKLSEQFSRTLSGGIELRLSSGKPKFQKDIGAAILSARGLVEQGLTELPSFPGIKQVKQFKLRRAEAKLIEFEKALPKLTELAGEFGGGDIIPLASRKGFIVPELETIPLVPSGKRGATGISAPLGDTVFNIPSLRKQAFGKPIKQPKAPKARRGRDLISSEIPSIKIEPSRFKPIASLVEPSIIAPSKIPKGQEVFPSIIAPLKTEEPEFPPPPQPEPSEIGPPVFPGPPPPPTITGGFNFNFDIDPLRGKKPQRIKRSDERKKKQKEKRLIGRERIIRPSFTGIITAQGIRSPLVGIEFERAARVTQIGPRDIGISPFALRGTRTGLAKPRKTKTKKKKKNSKKKRSLGDFGLTSI